MPNRTIRAELSIGDWVHGLAAIPAGLFTLEAVQHCIFEHPIECSSLVPYIFFSPQSYTRNLIFKNDVFECLALCWDIGQSSAIHDHNDKLGWMYLAKGQLFVQNYSLEERDSVRRTCHIVPTNAVELGSDHTSYVEREVAVHKVCNLPRYQQRAVSVHVYQQPMSQCEIYSLQTGTYEVAQLFYTSEFGRLNPGVKL